MGAQVLQIATIAIVGTVLYQLLMAINQRAMAALLKLACYGLCLVCAVQILTACYEATSKAFAGVSKSLDGLAQSYETVARLFSRLPNPFR